MKFYKVVFSVDGSIKKWKRFVFANSEEDAKTIIRKYYFDCYNFDFSKIQEIEIKKGIVLELIGDFL